MIRRWVFTWVALVAFVLSGCSGETLPTYDAARAEAEAAMQRVVDQLPADSRVVDTTDLTPYACSDGGGFFTGHWLVTPSTDFDTVQFVEDLPSRLADEFATQTPQVAHSYPVVELRTATGVSVTVSGSPNGEPPVVDILGMSRCAQGPTSPSP